MNRSHSSSSNSAYAYMFLFSMRFTEFYWVIYLRGKGLSFAVVGLMETVFHIASFSSEVPTGLLADRFGRRVSVFAGRLLAAGSAAVALYAMDWSLLMVSFALNAVSYTCHSGAFDALVYDSLPAERRGDFTALMGRLNSMYLLGTALAGGIAAAISRISLAWLYRAAVAVDVAAAVVALFLPEDPSATRSRRSGTPLSDLRSVWKSLERPDLRTLLLLWGVGGALGTSAMFYGQALLKESLLPVSFIGIAGTAAHLLAILPASSAYRVQRKFGQKMPMVAGSLMLTATIAALGFVPGSAGWMPRLAVVALYIGVPVLQEALYPLFSDAVNARTDSANRAAVLSSGSMMFSVAMMVTFPLIGYFGDRLGLRAGLVAAACLTAAGVIPLSRALLRPGALPETLSSSPDR